MLRLLFTLLFVVLVVGILSVVATNLNTTVSDLRVWGAVYDRVHIGYVVILSVAVGVVFASVFAIAEGASTRLENRKLRKELQQLDTEIGFLRGQRPAVAPPEPDDLEQPAGDSRPVRSAAPAETADPDPPTDLARAPVWPRKTEPGSDT